MVCKSAFFQKPTYDGVLYQTFFNPVSLDMIALIYAAVCDTVHSFVSCL